MIRFCLALVLCALLAVTANAAGQSFYGPTGLLFVPTAETLGMGEASIFANLLSVDHREMTQYGVNAGLGYGLEVGWTEVHMSGNGDVGGMLNAKWDVYKGNLVAPAIAIGAMNLTNSGDISGDIQPYFVATKSFTLPNLASLSVAAGYWAGTVDKAMFGAKLGLASNIELVADYIPDMTDLSVGARYNAPSGLCVQAGVTDGNFVGGVSYTRALGR